MSVVRRQVANGALTKRQGDNAVRDLSDLPIVIYPTAPLLTRAWELRANVTSYDACYIALAEALDCVFVTADARLANAPGIRCTVDVI